MRVLKNALVVTVGLLAMGIGAIGCSHGGPPVMLDPASTVTLQGDPIMRKVPSNGQISLFDVNQQKTVFSGRVKSGDTVTVDPIGRRIMIDNDVAADNLRGGDAFQILFDAGM